VGTTGTGKQYWTTVMVMTLGVEATAALGLLNYALSSA
jgi:hypothetical protein